LGGRPENKYLMHDCYSATRFSPWKFELLAFLSCIDRSYRTFQVNSKLNVFTRMVSWNKTNQLMHRF